VSFIETCKLNGVNPHDDLDKELSWRGHRFCRYADDCNIYVRSRRAGVALLHKRALQQIAVKTSTPNATFAESP
jgi:retron-type reverse transcriptase